MESLSMKPLRLEVPFFVHKKKIAAMGSRILFYTRVLQKNYKKLQKTIKGFVPKKMFRLKNPFFSLFIKCALFYFTTIIASFFATIFLRNCQKNARVRTKKMFYSFLYAVLQKNSKLLLFFS